MNARREDPVSRPLDDAHRDGRVTSAADAVERAVRDSLGATGRRVVLAVSGGRDSMALLAAAASVARDAVAAVATFDHGTSAAAARAADAVEAGAADAGFPVVRGRSELPGRSEAEWREARWRFLREVATAHGAAEVATAHTADDQIETVFLRALRGAGARGLAALAARTPGVVRPLLRLTRADVAAYAARRRVAYVEDPSNASRRHLRNRARLDLLPALERARPGFGASLLALGDRAAAWRREVDALAAALVASGDVVLDAATAEAGAELRVRGALVSGMEAPSLAVLWPALAALAGVTLDRRGTRRLAAFTSEGRSGGAIQLSGGVEVVRRRGEFVLRRRRGHTSGSVASDEGVALPVVAGARTVAYRRWRFAAEADEVTDDTAAGSTDSAWSIWLPAGAAAVARPWRAGDRMRSPTSGAARRVKRYFGDAGVAGVDRADWPVVVVGGEIVWIPGVRRAHAAPARSSGRPGVWLTCRTVREPTSH